MALPTTHHQQQMLAQTLANNPQALGQAQYLQNQLYNQLMSQAQSQVTRAVSNALINGYTTSSSTTNTIWLNVAGTGSGSNHTFVTTTPALAVQNAVWPDPPSALDKDIDLGSDGLEHVLHMADGTKIYVEKDGSFRIDDKNAKTVYKGFPTRDFNSYINASDKLEEFIKFCGESGVRQGDMLGIPIELFVKWLVIEAAKQDGEQAEPLVLSLPDYSKARCQSCGRFMHKRLKEAKMFFCRSSCYEIKQKKVLALNCKHV